MIRSSKLKDFLRRKSVKREEKKQEYGIGPSLKMISYQDILLKTNDLSNSFSMRKIQKTLNFVRQSAPRPRNKSMIPIKAPKKTPPRSHTPDFNKKQGEMEVVHSKKEIREFFEMDK